MTSRQRMFVLIAAAALAMATLIVVDLLQAT